MVHRKLKTDAGTQRCCHRLSAWKCRITHVTHASSADVHVGGNDLFMSHLFISTKVSLENKNEFMLFFFVVCIDVLAFFFFFISTPRLMCEGMWSPWKPGSTTARSVVTAVHSVSQVVWRPAEVDD